MTNAHITTDLSKELSMDVARLTKELAEQSAALLKEQERIKELERREKKAAIIMKKEMKQQSVDIYSDSGIDDNIADSIGVNLAFREMM